MSNYEIQLKIDFGLSKMRKQKGFDLFIIVISDWEDHV